MRWDEVSKRIAELNTMAHEDGDSVDGLSVGDVLGLLFFLDTPGIPTPAITLDDEFRYRLHWLVGQKYMISVTVRGRNAYDVLGLGFTDHNGENKTMIEAVLAVAMSWASQEAVGQEGRRG